MTGYVLLVADRIEVGPEVRIRPLDRRSRGHIFGDGHVLAVQRVEACRERELKEYS